VGTFPKVPGFYRFSGIKMNKKFMQLAIREARKNLGTLDGGPFGACIVRNGRPIAIARNTVLKTKDATCHAEINAIRLASKKLQRLDLSGCEIYSTTEPCPMCFSAIHWARIDKIVYGTGISEVKKLGFNELAIPARKMRCIGKSKVKIQDGFMGGECRALLKDWSRLASKKVY
jgi:guanine deaminase